MDSSVASQKLKSYVHNKSVSVAMRTLVASKFDKLGGKVIQNITSINMGFLERQYNVKELYCR